MAKINLSDIKEGMVTSEPVRIQNRVILGEGISITEKHIHLFKTWGVAFIDVVTDASSDSEVESTLSKEEKDLLLREIEERFSLIKKDTPLMTEIKRITEKLLLK